MVADLKKDGDEGEIFIAEIIENNQERFLTYYANQQKIEYKINIVASLLSIVWIIVFVIFSEL